MIKLLTLLLIFSCQNNNTPKSTSISKKVISSDKQSYDFVDSLDAESPLSIIKKLAKLKSDKKLTDTQINKLDKKFSIDCYLDYCSIERRR